MKAAVALQLFVTFIGVLINDVSGHGYLKSPRARNYVAAKDGLWYGGGSTDPEKESCPHCLNLGGTQASCGISGSHNYDHPKNALLGPLEWNAQTTYEAGSVIEIDALLTAHHKGHMELKACPVSPGQVASQACFDSHPLEFVSDELYGAPKDANYPGRAYIAPPSVAETDNSDGNSGKLFRYKFQLPGDVSGHVLLQWYYITGNSCTAAGYSEYPFPDYSWHGGTSECSHIPPDGVGVPEQFWNCAEVYIEGGGSGPTPTPPTTNSPVVTSTSSPVSSSTSSPVSSSTSSPVSSSSSSPVSSSTSSPVAPSPTTASPTRPPTDPSEKKIVGYYASWQYYDRDQLGKPENMDFTKVDRVNFAFFQPDTNGNLYGTDSWGDPLVLFGPIDYNPQPGATQYCSWDAPNQKSCSAHVYEKGLISLVHAAGAEIYPSIGGWTLSDNFPVVAASSAARTKLANQCVALIRDYDFDGIDIDWEYPGYGEHSGTPQDRENFNLLLSEVRSKLDSLGAETGKYYGLTAALPCGPSNISNMDIPHVSSVLDELLLMTYDFHGSWESITGVNAPLYYQGFGDMDFSLDACVQNWKAGGAPSSKISIGLAFYGRSFAYASGLNQPHQGADTNNWGEDEGLPQYFNIVDRLPAMTSVRHDVSKTQFAFFKNGNGFVSYDDERSICEKTEYAIANGLKGFLIWELTGDLMQDLSTPLLDMVNAKVANPNINCAGGSYTTAPSPSQTWSPTAKPTTQSPTSTPTIGSTDSPTPAPTPLAPTIATTDSPTAPITSPPTAAVTSLPTPSPTTKTTPAPTKSSTSAPTTSDSSTVTCPNGYTGLKATDHCTHYYHCVAGVVTGDILPCPAGTLFDESIQNFQHDWQFTCSDDPTTQAPTSTPGTTPPSPTPGTTPPSPSSGPSCPSGYSGMLAVDECTGFRYCTNGAFSSVKIACAAGTLFNNQFKYCDWAHNVNCAQRRLRGGLA